MTVMQKARHIAQDSGLSPHHPIVQRIADALAAERAALVPDIYWDEDNPESSCEPHDDADEREVGQVYGFQCARSLPNRYFICEHDTNASEVFEAKTMRELTTAERDQYLAKRGQEAQQ